LLDDRHVFLEDVLAVRRAHRASMSPLRHVREPEAHDSQAALDQSIVEELHGQCLHARL
jgi:hypothetical protein